MQNPWSRLTHPGTYVLGTALGITLLGGFSPLSLESLPATALLRTTAAVAQSNVDEETNIQVYQIASPAVVAIDAGDGSGSGSIVSATGLILTNAHVVGSNRVVQVRLADGREFTGDVVGYADNRVDLAAIQLRGNPTSLPTIQIASPESLRVGQRAFAIGSPFGLE
ncbi:MAG: trypsin-like serine protease, partial [Leptolyngbya sp. SIO1D8]|nr:trypsin-like serine protease [Leptolyngbya sp. SIO1D8]